MKQFMDATERSRLTCPKCRANGAWKITYREAGSTDSYGDPGAYSYHWPEHHEVSCRGCGFAFDMQPADAGEPA